MTTNNNNKAIANIDYINGYWAGLTKGESNAQKRDHAIIDAASQHLRKSADRLKECVR